MEKQLSTDHRKKALQAIILMMEKPPPKKQKDNIVIKRSKGKLPVKAPAGKE